MFKKYMDMKKTVIAIAFVLISMVGIHAQNIQLHYDFGDAMYDDLGERHHLTTTVEMFKPDKWGSTFFFVDMDYSNNEVSSAYWEIARELKFWEKPISIHVEYDGGLNYIKDSYLGGVTYTWNRADYNSGMSLSAMYKYIYGCSTPNSCQLTGTWYVNFANGKFLFSGYADFWREEHVDMNGNEHNFVFMTEPQLWFNLNKLPKVDDNFNLSIGTEWKIYSNFALMDGWYLIPTLALKWTFD